jgi:hypothetical protein
MPRKYRVGLLPALTDDNAEHLHRAALIVTRAAHGETYYGRAVAGHLEEQARAHRLPEVGALVVWGSDETAVGRLAMSNPHAMMVLILPRKPKKEGKLSDAMGRLAKAGSDVHVLTISAKAKATAWDVGAGRTVDEAADLRRPPQQQHAPNVNLRRKGEVAPTVAPHHAPSIPRPEAAPTVAPHHAPSVPRDQAAPTVAPHRAPSTAPEPAPEPAKAPAKAKAAEPEEAP